METNKNIYFAEKSVNQSLFLFQFFIRNDKSLQIKFSEKMNAVMRTTDSDDEASEVKSSAKRSKSSVYRPEEEAKKYEAVFLTFYLNAKLNENGGTSLLLENKLSDRLILKKELKKIFR